jgi:hypothetical protein
MWFIPSERNLAPPVGQKAVEKGERTNTLLPFISNGARAHALFILIRRCIPASFKEGIVWRIL